MIFYKKYFIITTAFMLLSVWCFAQTERTLLVDFSEDKMLDSNFSTVYFTKSEVVAEAVTEESKKSITLINLYLPVDQKIKRMTAQLCTFFILPIDGQNEVNWLPLAETDSLVQTALNETEFTKTLNVALKTDRVYKITKIILKKGTKYYTHKGYLHNNLAEFDDQTTYYPIESVGLNCYSRWFSRKEIREEMRKIKDYTFSHGGFDNDSRGLSIKAYINGRDSITGSFHFEQYFDLDAYNIEMYNGYCSKEYPNYAHLHFTQFDVHPLLGMFGFFLYCYTPDLSKKEADKLGYRYYKFKRIGGYDNVNEYLNSFRKNKGKE